MLRKNTNCGSVEQPSSIDNKQDVNEEFNNLFKELLEELQTDSEITACEYFNFGYEVCASFPPINADMFNWRRASESTCIHKYGDAGDIAIEVETHNDNDENN